MTAAAASSEYVRVFNRFELKYLIHHTQARALMDLIAPHVRSDPNRGIDGFYKVVSLYYDSPDLRCYWEKIDGEKYRRKVRVRSYGPRPDKAFLEVKQRYNLNVQKRRYVAPIDVVKETMGEICAGKYRPRSEPVFDEVFVLARTYALRPTMLISYQRAAFFDRYKRDLRITIDRSIKCRNLDLDITGDRMSGRFAVPPTVMVLELKFNEAMPRWLCTFLNRFDLQFQRLSKYCCGVERSGLVHARGA